MRLADKMILELSDKLREEQRKYVMPNLYINGRECDVYSETISGYSHEYEIKISRNDFLNDINKGSKHLHLAEGKRVNRFWYVIPFLSANLDVKPYNLVFADEIPSYSGLIYYYGDSRFEIMVSAPLLSKEKRQHHKVIMEVSYYRYVEYQRRIIKHNLKLR